MYVCLCRGVTDGDIKQAVAAGASSMKALRQCLGVCSECGKCGACARNILRESLYEQDMPTPLPEHALIPATP
ncbi:bacterioferritin-associated ferredoxin [Thioalkalivibrio sulfidiphilus]|uniref:Bacterioferritin-associated ferredoxin n=1 Tax=Thioalkalivibrio sulfidiphilus (strain HL-EbGR7) TaxID=396588 RepID=B8GMY6_THISH|nr:bacterioferritin-associated ferredoxin [Thioalkalivibrio sulfidiphilus]ACL73801.1 BFD domain protein (2Fe-2S)-binding domain protein [Thioalkalivibrio sulfidiphilus HL-EbGr7]